MNSAVLTAVPPRSFSAARFLDLFRPEPVFAGAGLLMLLLMLPTLAAIAIDPRLHLGENIWIKPLKFEFALAVFLLTLAAFARWLPSGMTQKIWYRLFAAAVVFSALAEMVWIGGAAAMGTASHFNVSTPLLGSLYSLMGVFAAVITSASTLYGVQIWWNKDSGLPPALSLSLASGLIMTLPLTLVTAGYLASNGGHFVGGSGTDAAGLAIMGWSRDGGDLRVPHFFALHAMHFVPLFGFVVGKVVAQSKAKAFVLAFSALYVGLVAYSFVEAIEGQPFLAFIG
ncbi:hypothetical protein [Pelagibius sp. Alg239-R121]|uniref:hypothetical protein n=1 Tax=Pelagibius sp. Alg239-R121 TaxID=2993448 RepID=UPI0024A757CD|nr:hypothetical protein [Pelagibius sp. Alg239-R121]